MKRFILKIGSCVCALALATGVLAGCMGNAGAANPEQQANRAYMSQVNGVMDELGANLDSFVDSVSRGDVVNMRTQADNAYKTLDELNSLKVPDNLSDIQQKYLDGTSKLRKALDEYIELYTEISAGSFDQSKYASRIADIQALYDEGVAALKQGDEAAASKQ